MEAFVEVLIEQICFTICLMLFPVAYLNLLNYFSSSTQVCFHYMTMTPADFDLWMTSFEVEYTTTLLFWATILCFILMFANQGFSEYEKIYFGLSIFLSIRLACSSQRLLPGIFNYFTTPWQYIFHPNNPQHTQVRFSTLFFGEPQSFLDEIGEDWAHILRLNATAFLWLEEFRNVVRDRLIGRWLGSTHKTQLVRIIWWQFSQLVQNIVLFAPFFYYMASGWMFKDGKARVTKGSYFPLAPTQMQIQCLLLLYVVLVSFYLGNLLSSFMASLHKCFHYNESHILVAESQLGFDETCVICYEPPTSAIRLPCRHVYCMQCICMWFETSQTCPYCRRDYMIHL